jgi:CheY-like chemotaxis protein/nitrogen-specific signal transduction histidine kinase
VIDDRALRERIAELEELLAQEILWRQDAEAVARQAVDVKQQFLAAMSHELRTPLNGLIGASELALDLPLDAEAHDYVQLIHRSSLALFDVLNGILDVVRLEAGQLVLQHGTFDVRSALAATAARYAPAATGKGLSLVVDDGGAGPLRVEGDELRFCQVLGHLVGNAVKFTEHGSVRVVLHAAAGPDAIIDLTVGVQDTGIGIRPEDLQRIFTMFSQSETGASRAYGGTGLGLAVSQRLAQLMGGALGVSSVHGRGSTFLFRVEMPLAGTQRAKTPAGRDREAGTGAPGRDAAAAVPVLLVEDNPVNRALAQRMLQKAGCRVEVAENGATAVQMARERDYAAIFMDLQMPVMDGLQATREIRRQEGDGPHVPIIAVTANAMTGDRDLCLASGMDDYLPKPLRAADLKAAVGRWCAASLRTA